MKEIIESIEEVFNYNKGGYINYDGYRIKTNKQEILILITNSQQCCESWGYFDTADDYNEFLNSELKEIRWSNDENTKVFELAKEDSIENAYFIDLVTSSGLLQIAVYNEHNGYYGHNVIIESDQLKENGGL